MIQLTAQDFERVGQLAAHCDNKKLAIAVEEAIKFDLERVLCDLWLDIEINWTKTELEAPEFYKLINGGTYQGCGDKLKKHYGIKNALIYYAYARYVILNGFNDSPVGHVQKQNPFSTAKPLKELEAYSEKYRNMGYETLKGVENFLCISGIEIFPNYNRKACAPCGCAGQCNSDTNTTGFGLKTKIISKWDV